MMPVVKVIWNTSTDNVSGNDSNEDIQEVEGSHPQSTDETEDIEEQVDQLEDEYPLGPAISS